MTIDTNLSELRRIRRDFKVEARRYPDLVLTRYYMDERLITPSQELMNPEHIISLWQYIRTISKGQVREVLDSLYPSKYGLLGGSVSAFAIIHGDNLNLFRRMAARAGSLTVVSNFVEARVVGSLMRTFEVPTALGKNLFVCNSNPLSVWINMVLFCLAAFQPRRFAPLSLPVDPFTASLTACDYLLEALRPPQKHSPADANAAQPAKPRTRWDETWHRLREWTSGQGPSERLAAQILLSEGYTSLDPSHPLGGPDGGRDAITVKDGRTWVMAAFFPLGQKKFAEIKGKFLHDLRGAKKHRAGLAFVTNQALSNAEKEQLRRSGKPTRVELFHLERLTAILDQPSMAPVRRQYLSIE